MSNQVSFAINTSFNVESKATQIAIAIFQNECTNALEWFRGSSMIVKFEKFQPIVLTVRTGNGLRNLFEFCSLISTFRRRLRQRLSV